MTDSYSSLNQEVSRLNLIQRIAKPVIMGIGLFITGMLAGAFADAHRSLGKFASQRVYLSPVVRTHILWVFLAITAVSILVGTVYMLGGLLWKRGASDTGAIALLFAMFVGGMSVGAAISIHLGNLIP